MLEDQPMTTTYKRVLFSPKKQWAVLHYYTYVGDSLLINLEIYKVRFRLLNIVITKKIEDPKFDELTGLWRTNT